MNTLPEDKELDKWIESEIERDEIEARMTPKERYIQSLREYERMLEIALIRVRRDIKEEVNRKTPTGAF